MKRKARKYLPHNLRKKSYLPITDGVKTRLVYVDDLIDICGFSRSHAYRVLKGEIALNQAYEELLKIKLLGLIPGWPPGFYLTKDSSISCPNGQLINHTMAEQYSFHLQIVNSMASDLSRAIHENSELRAKIDSITELKSVPNRQVIPSLKLVKA